MAVNLCKLLIGCWALAPAFAFAQSSGAARPGDTQKLIKQCRETAKGQASIAKCGNIPMPTPGKEQVVKCGGGKKLRVAFKNLDQKASIYGAHLACTVILDDPQKKTKDAAIVRHFQQQNKNKKSGCTQLTEFTKTFPTGRQRTQGGCSSNGVKARSTDQSEDYQLLTLDKDGKEQVICDKLPRDKYVKYIREGEEPACGTGKSQKRPKNTGGSPTGV